MSVDTQAVLAGQVAAAAKAAGLVVVSSAVGADFSGNATTRFQIALAADTKKTELLELSDKFDFSQTELLAQVGVYLAESAKRLKNPSATNAPPTTSMIPAASNKGDKGPAPIGAGKPTSFISPCSRNKSPTTMRVMPRICGESLPKKPMPVLQFVGRRA